MTEIGRLTYCYVTVTSRGCIADPAFASSLNPDSVRRVGVLVTRRLHTLQVFIGKVLGNIRLVPNSFVSALDFQSG